MEEEDKKPEPSNEESPQKGLPDDVVKSIFEKDVKRPEPSSVFGQDSAKEGLLKPPSEERVAHLPEFSPEQRQKLSKLRGSSSIGIDIGSFSVKIVQLTFSDKGPQIAKLIIQDLPGKLQGSIYNQKNLMNEFLQNILKENRIRGSVYSAIPSNVVHYKHVVLPRMPLEEISGALKWEIQQGQGAGVEDISYDYLILNEEKSVPSDKMDVMIVSSEKKEVLRHLELLEEAGLKVLAIEPESLSLLANLRYGQKISKEEVVLLLDLGGCATRLNIIRNKELHFSRYLNINGEALTMAIKDYCRVSLDEAEMLKRNYTPSTPAMESQEASEGENTEGNQANQTRTIKHAISLLLEKLVSDIEHTFKYYSYQLTKSEVTQYDRIIVTGGSANFPIIVPFLKERFHVPVTIDNPMSAFRFADVNLEKNQRTKDDASRFGVALGLALRALE